MPASHLYPNLSDSCPIFMFGRFDLDNKDSGSALVLGKALLSVRKKVRRRAKPRRRV